MAGHLARGAALIVSLLAAAPAAQAELPPLIPRPILFGNPERSAPRLSPDGKQLSFIAPDEKNVLQIWVVPLEGGKPRVVTADKKRGVRSSFWSDDGAQILYLQDQDGDENWHLHGVELATGNDRDYTPFQGVRAGIVARHPDRPDEVLVSLNLRTRSAEDVHRLSLRTGALTLDTQNPGDVGGWVADAKLRVLGAQVQLPDGGTELRVREGESAPWRVLLRCGPDDEVGLHGFTPDGKSAIVETSLGRDKSQLVERRLDTGEEKLIASSEEVDVGEVLVEPRSKRVQAVSFVAARRSWVAIDPSIAGDLAAIGKLFDGDFIVTSRDAADAHWTVAFDHDRGPVRFYHWDRAARRGKQLFSAQPKLDGYALAKMEPISFEARDGLRLPGYLTVPPGVARKLPLVLLVHGGPWHRDRWGYDRTVQWLANRGYAVLQINFRSSTGYGKAHVNAGNKQWALKMHDDLLDGIDWAVKRGVADPARVAVYGGSYGGYAALVAATFTPDRFACNVDIVGPSNLMTLLGSIPPYWKPIRGLFNRRLGNADDPKDAELIRNASPLFKADKITKPLLIGQGANDPRVKQAEAEQIVAAIDKHAGKVTYILYPDEGHGFARAENNIDFAARAETFLAGCLGGRHEPLEGERVPGSTAVVRVVGGH